MADPAYFSDDEEGFTAVSIPASYHKPNYRRRLLAGLVTPALPVLSKAAHAAAIAAGGYFGRRIGLFERDNRVNLAPYAYRWALRAATNPVDTFQSSASLLRLARGSYKDGDYSAAARLLSDVAPDEFAATRSALNRSRPVRRLLNFTDYQTRPAQPRPGYMTDISEPFALKSVPVTPARPAITAGPEPTPRTLLAAGLSTPGYMHQPWYYERFRRGSPRSSEFAFRAHINSWKYAKATKVLTRLTPYHRRPLIKYVRRIHFRRDASGRRRRYSSFRFSRFGNPFYRSPRRSRYRRRNIPEW